MSKAPQTRRLRIESLEDRTVPAFVVAPNYPVVAGTSNVHPVDIVAADFNGDGKADAATANEGGNSVSVLIGKGNGTFKSPAAYAVGVDPVAVLAIDVNRDGKLDLVTANRGSESVSVLVGNGDGTFKAAPITAPDRLIDLASGTYRHRATWPSSAGRNAVMFKATRPGPCRRADRSPSAAREGACGADFNGDQKPDVATVSGDLSSTRTRHRGRQPVVQSGGDL